MQFILHRLTWCAVLFLTLVEIKIVKTVLSQTLMFAMNQPLLGQTNVSLCPLPSQWLKVCFGNVRIQSVHIA